MRSELIAELACAIAQPEQFDRELLALFERHIGADVSFFCSSAGVSEASRGLDPRVLPLARERWGAMTLEVRRLLPVALGAGGVVVDSQLLGAELTRLVYYDTFMRPHRGRTTLLGFLHYHGRCLGELVLGRSHGSSDFHARDLACLRDVMPTLSVARYGCQLAAARDGGQRRLVEAAPAPQPCGAGDALSQREREVWSYLHLGYTNQQIALALGSATRTVRNQLSRVYEKLGVGSRAEAVAAWHGTNVPWSERAR